MEAAPRRRRKQDHAVAVPRASASFRGVGHHDRRGAVESHLLQLSVGEERDRAAVGRPERIAAEVRAFDRPRSLEPEDAARCARRPRRRRSCTCRRARWRDRTPVDEAPPRWRRDVSADHARRGRRAEGTPGNEARGRGRDERDRGDDPRHARALVRPRRDVELPRDPLELEPHVVRALPAIVGILRQAALAPRARAPAASAAAPREIGRGCSRRRSPRSGSAFVLPRRRAGRWPSRRAARRGRRCRCARRLRRLRAARAPCTGTCRGSFLPAVSGFCCGRAESVQLSRSPASLRQAEVEELRAGRA